MKPDREEESERAGHAGEKKKRILSVESAPSCGASGPSFAAHKLGQRRESSDYDGAAGHPRHRRRRRLDRHRTAQRCLPACSNPAKSFLSSADSGTMRSRLECDPGKPRGIIFLAFFSESFRNKAEPMHDVRLVHSLSRETFLLAGAGPRRLPQKPTGMLPTGIHSKWTHVAKLDSSSFEIFILPSSLFCKLLRP